MTCGIYKIICVKTGNFYVGSSKNPQRRWREHKKGLKTKRHPSKYLQHSWDLYGEDNFKFEIIENVVNFDDLLIREQFYLDNLSPKFNTCKIAKGGPILKGEDNFSSITNWEDVFEMRKLYFNSDLTIKEVGEIFGMPKSATSRIISNLTWVDKNYVPPTKLFIKQKRAKKIAEIQKGEKNQFFNKKHTEETKRKMKEAWTTRKSNKIIVISQEVENK